MVQGGVLSAQHSSWHTVGARGTILDQITGATQGLPRRVLARSRPCSVCWLQSKGKGGQESGLGVSAHYYTLYNFTENLLLLKASVWSLGGSGVQHLPAAVRGRSMHVMVERTKAKCPGRA